MSNAFDRRRANGPENTFQPLYHVHASSSSAPSGALWCLNAHRVLQDPVSVPSHSLFVHELEGDDGLTSQHLVTSESSQRVDQRGSQDSRALRMLSALTPDLQTGIVPSASGSVLLECGRTKLICAVHGPRQVRGRQYAGKAELNVLFQMAPFSDVVRQKPGKDTEKPGLSALIQQALLPSVRLELLPKSSIDVYVTVLDSDTSELGLVALSVTAASVAIAEAGVDMLGLVTGSAAVCLII